MTPSPELWRDYNNFLSELKQTFGKMTEKKIKIVCNDGVELSAILIEPENPVGSVIINSGTGTKKEFYLPFAKFLTENKYNTIVFDYRGNAESAPETLKNCEFEYIDYGLKDIAAVLDFLDVSFPTLPKYIVGHSVGGQMIGFVPNHHKINGLVMVASSTGFWRTMYVPYRYKAYFFFWIYSPISIFLKGYVAAKRFKMMEDLPKNVAKTWADWCSVPNYFWNERFYGKSVPKGNFDSLNFPIKHYWASDDPIANKKNVDVFLSYWKSSAGIHSECFHPNDFGVKSIDHFGFFKRGFRDSIWKKMLVDLEGFRGRK